MSPIELSAVDRMRYEAELEILGSGLAARGHTVLPLQGEPLPTLRVDLGTGGCNRSLTIAFLPQEGKAEDGEPVLFQVELYAAVPSLRHQDLDRAIEIVNPAMTLGHFVLDGMTLYYRHIARLPVDDTFDAAEVSSLIHVIEAEQAQFGDYLAGIIDDEIPLSLLPKVMAEAN